MLPAIPKSGDAAPLSAAEPIRATEVRAVQYAEVVPTAQQQQQQVPNATVIQVVYAQEPQFGSYPTRTVCQFCGCDVVTDVHARAGLTAHLWAIGLCVFGCWPCCIVPYFVNECQAHSHACPNCGREIGYHGM